MANTDSHVTIHMAASLDGFIARKDGSVDWNETSDEFVGGETMDPGFVEAFLKTIDCYVMGLRTSAAEFQNRIAQLIRNRFAVVFAVSPPLIEAGLKFKQIVRDRIHRIPPKIRPGFAGNDNQNGAQKSGAIAESVGLQRTVRGSTHKPFMRSTDGCRRDT
jgi:hypothetical protein